MLKVGITGGIGSGKTIVCRVFETLGIPVYYADDRAKSLMDHDAAIRKQIIEVFGPKSYDTQGLNRKYLASIIFSNPSLREQLDAITHPAVIKDGMEWMQKQSAPFTLKEAALLFESGSYRQLDYIIGVQTPLALRLHRTMQRDGKTKEEIEKIISAQMNEDDKMKRCDFIIHNNDQNSVIQQVWNLYHQLLAIQ